MNTVRIAIVEHHTLMRRSLVSWVDGLNQRFQVIFDCATGNDLVNFLKTSPAADRPDILMTGYQMPGMDGFEVTTWIKNRFPDIKIIVLSNQHDDVVIIRLIKAGISGYLVKSFDGDEILAALETIADGGTYFKSMDWNTIINLPEIEPAVKTWYSLSAVEREFVRLCTTELSEMEIKEKLGINQYFREHPITKVYEKFGIKSRIALVLLVAKHRLFDLNL